MEFSSSFQKLNFERRAVSFPEGCIGLVMKICRREIQLCFDQPQFEAIHDGLKKAAVMVEANNILKT